MSWLHFVILIPFVFAIFVPFFINVLHHVFIPAGLYLAVPLLVFLYLLRYIPYISNGKTVYHSVPWFPSLGINYTTYIDGLGLIFGLLITGVGALVVLYSIYYMSKHREALHNFYVYLLLFMGAMLGLVFWIISLSYMYFGS